MPLSAIDQQPGKATATHRIGPGEIAGMMRDLFSCMIEMPFNSEPQASTDVSSRDVQATIRISGDWNAECHVLVSDELAARMASDMFGAPASELSNEEILDALGEVVNVIGGNVKGIVDLDCDLSLPCVGRFLGELPASALKLDFDCAGMPITVAMLEN
ncbi:MAG: chemotaxis protein CheX [Planctomycetaceae bacterium]|jgi:chemotaxis protein CheX